MSFINHPRHSTQRTKQADLQVESTRAMELFHHTTTVLNFLSRKAPARKNMRTVEGATCLCRDRLFIDMTEVKKVRGWVEIVCTARLSTKEKAINAKVRAFLSTYLDIALGNIGRLKGLAYEQM